MKKYIGLAIALTLAIGALIAIRMASPQHPADVPIARNSIPTPAVLPPPAVSPPSPTVPPPAEPEPVTSSPAKPVAPVQAPPNPAQSAQAAKPVQSTASPPEPARDPDARVALAYVGMDPDAEAYWVDAINDPSLSAEERQNLIEDLNEDGLSDPKNPGPQDLPIILNRLAIIEEIGPYAMDKVNFDAFSEAYKIL